MKKNYNVNHFSSTAFDISKTRTKFYRPSTHKTSFTTGKLIPLYVDEVLPGDTRQISVDSVVRGATPLYPVMDNAYLDIFAFFTPNRLVMDEWESFLGVAEPDAWNETTSDILIPRISLTCDPSKTKDYLLHTPIDYMGAVGSINGAQIDTNLCSFPYFSALFPRSYVKTWNDWFRDENTMQMALLEKDSVDRGFLVDSKHEDYIATAQYGLSLLPVAKFHDYFTSALPSPQKHAPITLPISGILPVMDNGGKDLFQPKFYLENGNVHTSDSPRILQKSTQGTTTIGGNGVSGATPSYYSMAVDVGSATTVNIDQFNLAVKTQMFYQAMARGGSRYIELLKSMFGVYASDARLQRSEYLGGKRVPITQTQVAQTSSNSGSQLLGDTGAFSLTGDSSNLVFKSFSEHGILQIYACVRTDQTYSQGQERQFARRSLFDFYFPVFAMTGERAIKNKEIFTEDYQSLEENFGYQENWVEYRTKQNRVSGLMRPEISGGLSSWNYANKFDNLPVLGEEFIKETRVNVDRTLAVTDSEQWFGDFFIQDYATRVMPAYSIMSLSTRF